MTTFRRPLPPKDLTELLIQKETHVEIVGEKGTTLNFNKKGVWVVSKKLLATKFYGEFENQAEAIQTFWILERDE